MKRIDLNSIETTAPKHLDKDSIKKHTDDLVKRIGELQNVMFAEGKHSLLVVLQGMDASGKGGAVKKVFSEINPSGVKVQAFKVPTPEERAHDFLWRVHKVVPQKGYIQVFDRSHYEEVLITRVEGWCDDNTAYARFAHINAFERLLTDSNTHVLKFYLHVSQAEQRSRFYERLTSPHKQWKYGPEDLQKAKQWPAYQKAYEDVFYHCNTTDCPWIIVPSDQNWYKEYLIAKTVVDKLESLQMSYPELRIDMNDPLVQELLTEVQNYEKTKKKS